MSLKEELELLQRIPFFANVEPAKLKLLAFTSERVAFEPDQVLFKQGDPGDAAYIIVEGEAEVLVETQAGPTLVATFAKNAFFGEMAILCDIPRTATMRAKGRLVTLRISKDLFLRLITEFPTMAVAMMRELAHRLELTNQRLRDALGEVNRLKKPA